ncbi:MAG: hypothetical protein ACYDD1_00695 [Caulobacteraceae bacterium]
MISISKTVAVAVVTALWGGLVVTGVKVAATRDRRRRQVNPLAKQPTGGASMLGFSSSHARGWRNRTRRLSNHFARP